jgi:DMSO/TMAO reductase YedYZ molybdopterin-dependent catalytic subunit
VLLFAALSIGIAEWAARSRPEPIAWDLALVGSTGEVTTLSYDQVLALPPVTVTGGFFSSVGAIYGPYTLKGVPLENLLGLVGGMTPNDVLMVGAQDGYSSVFDYRQLHGEIDSFAPDSLRLIPGAPVEFLLIYEQDGRPLAENDGHPLRLAVASADGLLTEGHWWVRWVNRLQVRSLPPVAGR